MWPINILKIIPIEQSMLKLRLYLMRYSSQIMAAIFMKIMDDTSIFNRFNLWIVSRLYILRKFIIDTYLHFP